MSGAIEPSGACHRLVTGRRLVRGGAGFHGKQGLDYFSGVSAESSGARAICMHLLEMPPGHGPNEQESVVLLEDMQSACPSHNS